MYTIRERFRTTIGNSLDRRLKILRENLPGVIPLFVCFHTLAHCPKTILTEKAGFYLQVQHRSQPRAGWKLGTNRRNRRTHCKDINHHSSARQWRGMNSTVNWSQGKAVNAVDCLARTLTVIIITLRWFYLPCRSKDKNLGNCAEQLPKGNCRSTNNRQTTERLPTVDQYRNLTTKLNLLHL